MARERLRGVLLYGLGVVLLSLAAGCAVSGPMWARTWLYVIAWSGILLTLDGMNGALSGESLLISTPERFFGLYALSVPWWLFFELLNFRLKNWAYDGVPAGELARWSGYALAFGTVLPALAEARQLLATLLPLKRLAAPAFRVSEGVRDTMRLLGLAFLVLPMLWPNWFFPLIWGFAFLLFEPGLSREAPLESVLFDMSLGSAEALLSWAGAGLVCGVLWEAANWWAAGRWVYTLPFDAGPKVFEMPLAGFGGFPAFALECASVVGLAGWLWSRMSTGARAAAVFTLSAFSAAVFAGIDALTVRSFAP